LSFCLEGEYKVYAKFYAPGGRSSEVVSDSIIYTPKESLQLPAEQEKEIVPEITPPKEQPIICGPYLTKYIKFGDKNDINEVKKLQEFLNKFEKEKLNVNGIYDQANFEAVKRFQKKYEKDVLPPWGITNPTGFVYKTTTKKINEIYCQGKPVEISVETAKKCPIFVKSLKLGSKDEEVKKVQQFLIDQGFLSKDFQISDVFDKTTEQAVKQFQTKYPDEILKPWNLTASTGYWHITTKKKANELMGCAIY
jgi:peptidoglycan hydrolase-like protein with peptidoglycan-binding domain